MSRRPSSRPESPAPKAAAIPTAITDIPQLAAAARRLGQTDRVIQVDAPEPQRVRTPGRRVGQWLVSGQMLPGSALADYRPGSALADPARDGAERGGAER